MKRMEVNRDQLSPMMIQYMTIKDNYPEELLFFRLGDFYELFFEDGLTAARELELTLTGKNAGLKERIPMCGVPFHAVQPYIEKLVNKGYKVAICEQLEDPKGVKGVVKRGVIQVISKGTIVDYEMLNAYDKNFIASILDFKSAVIITYADVSTGNLYVSAINNNNEEIINFLLNINVKEVIFANEDNPELLSILKSNYGIDINYSNEYLEKKYEYLLKDIKDMRYSMGVKHLLYYLVIKELKDVSHFQRAIIINNDEYLEMDVHTRRNLELNETIRLKERTNSLIWLIDQTKTAMGSRKLKEWLNQPLKDINKINDRYDQIEKINTEFIIKEELRKLLAEVYDLERLGGKVICGSLNARDMLQIKNSIAQLPIIEEYIQQIGLPYKITKQEALFNLLAAGIYENPPIGLKEGFLIKDNYNAELDELKVIRSGGKKFISELEAQERAKTGIKTLKVGYTKVFGYFIEVSKGQLSAIKPEFGWERRQTLTNAERFISPLLKEKEALVLNAEEKIIELEYELFNQIKAEIRNHIYELQDTANALAELDAIISLAVDAEELNLVRPQLVEARHIEIIEGRHPVVEKVNRNAYVPNDCIMSELVHTLLITGPNMAGKSTYLRQLAIIIIMAQMGSFVPAKKAQLPIFDKIFTRIGASDDLVAGESTFMVEMKEAQRAITNATNQSLILFDELGRGTATYDGMSLAQAILEYINQNIKCKTLFSTHYHELTDLESMVAGIKNVHVAAIEEAGEITFLHKVKNGAVDKSYGIHVARLAKLPPAIIQRADNILKIYESEDKRKSHKIAEQCVLVFDEEPQKNEIVEKIRNVDPLNITPIEAMNLLYELKQLDK
ncbi:MAG TPA: DNA mismatch repair protein MutS [Bacilli bacterium]|nr:DNA mismatch repair protein MutS [Bacilli bacterium]